MVHGKSPIGAKSATKRFTFCILAHFVISVISATTRKAEVSCRRYKKIFSTARGRFSIRIDRHFFLTHSSLRLKHTRERSSCGGLGKALYRSDPGDKDIWRVITVHRPFNRYIGFSVVPSSLSSHLPHVRPVYFVASNVCLGKDIGIRKCVPSTGLT